MKTVSQAERTEFGAYLRGLRQSAGKSLRQVHRESGVASGYLSLIETGARNPPTHRFLASLAACYGVPQVEMYQRAAGETEPEDAGTAELRWAYRAALADPSTPPEVMRAVVALYEGMTGKRLLRRQEAEDGG